MALIPLPDVYETIVRKVAADAIRQIGDSMQIPTTAKVYLPGRTDSVPMNDGIFGNVCDSHNAVYFDPEERIVIGYEEIADENYSLSTAVFNNDNYPLISDDVRFLEVRPVSRFVDFRIDIEYQAPNIVIAQRWLDQQRMRYSAGAAELTLNLTYHYNIPKPLLSLLEALYSTEQDSPKPFHGEFEDWLKALWTSPTTEIGTFDDQYRTLSVYERAIDVVGWVDFYNTPDTPELASDNSGAYTTNFSFLCRYARPTHLKVNYPLLVNNYVIPKQYFQNPKYRNYQSTVYKTTEIRSALRSVKVNERSPLPPFVNHPHHDDWHPLFNLKSRLLLFAGLLVVCEGSETQVLNLESLGSCKFNDFWLEFIKNDAELLIGTNRLFDFRIFRNNRDTDIRVHVDKDTMDLKADLPLTIDGYYHVALYLNTHVGSVPKDFWDKLKYYPNVFIEFNKLFRTDTTNLEDLKLIGFGRDRDQPGEGTTIYTSEYERLSNNSAVPTDSKVVLEQGYIRDKDIYDFMFKVDNKDYRPGSIYNLMRSGMIVEKR